MERKGQTERNGERERKRQRVRETEAEAESQTGNRLTETRRETEENRNRLWQCGGGHCLTKVSGGAWVKSWLYLVFAEFLGNVLSCISSPHACV